MFRAQSIYALVLSEILPIVLCLSFVNLAIGDVQDDIDRVFEGLGIDVFLDEEGRVNHAEVFDTQAVTLDGIRLLWGRETIEYLDLSGVKLGSEVFEIVGTLRGLNVLELKNTDCTDADLQRIQGMANLETLSLDGTSVTDGCLPTLSLLPNLKTLEIDRTAITEAGIKRLCEGRSDIELIETWDCFAGIREGCAVLDIERAIIYLSDPPEKSGQTDSGISSGGGSTFTLVIADGDTDLIDSDWSGAGGGGGFHATMNGSKFVGINYDKKYVNGLPVIQANGHLVEIADTGKAIVVNGSKFVLDKKKQEIVLDSEGRASLYHEQSE